MRVALVLATLLIAGCAVPPDDGTGPDLDALMACDMSYPDGSAVDCQADHTTQPLDALPDGFMCTAQHETDETAGIERTWAHPDGRVAVSWDWPEDAMGGTPRVSLMLVEGETVQVMDVPFGGEGYAIFPEPARGDDAVVFTWMRFFDIESPEMDVAEARLHATDFEGHSWYVWAVPTEDGTAYFEIMAENDDSDSPLRFYPSETTLQDPLNVTMSQWTKGVRYKPGAAHVTGLRNRWCPEPLGLETGLVPGMEDL